MGTWSEMRRGLFDGGFFLGGEGSSRAGCGLTALRKEAHGSMSTSAHGCGSVRIQGSSLLNDHLFVYLADGALLMASAGALL